MRKFWEFFLNEFLHFTKIVYIIEKGGFFLNNILPILLAVVFTMRFVLKTLARVIAKGDQEFCRFIYCR